MAAMPGLHTLGKTGRTRNLHTSRCYHVSVYKWMARLHARSWGLQQNDRHTAATPRVDWRSSRQETKKHVAAMH
eukprot:3605351-Lingulodinium_polyedra.AAC.1